ncbi:hypothetical protein D3C75_747310 [compost metagenome]
MATARETTGNSSSPKSWSGLSTCVNGPRISPNNSKGRIAGSLIAHASHCAASELMVIITNKRGTDSSIKFLPYLVYSAILFFSV